MSNLIKAEFAKPEVAKKVIQLKSLTLVQQVEESAINHDELYKQAETILQNAKIQSETLQLKAQQEYENMLLKVKEEKEKWEIERSRLQEEAKTKGYQDGLHQGKQEGLEQYNEQINFAQNIVKQSKVEAAKHVEESEKTILNLSLKIVEQILRIKLDEDQEVFINIVKQVLKETKEHHDLNLFVHPSKYDLIIQHKDELQAINNREKDLLIYPDNDLNEESCILESSFGRIDASIDSQLLVLKEKLQGLLEEE